MSLERDIWEHSKAKHRKPAEAAASNQHSEDSQTALEKLRDLQNHREIKKPDLRNKRNKPVDIARYHIYTTQSPWQ